GEGSIVWTQIAVALQRSVVQRSPSSAQLVPADLGWHVPEQQDSIWPLVGPSSHCSVPSTTPLPHCSLVPWQTPLVHWSFTVPALPSSQDVPLETKPSAGHTAVAPVQCSATSQTPAKGRHVVLLDAKASAGQLLPTPSHDSATSQTPALARHTAVLFWSAGQAPPVPVQCSARSQTPADARQVRLVEAKPAAGPGGRGPG